MPQAMQGAGAAAAAPTLDDVDDTIDEAIPPGRADRMTDPYLRAVNTLDVIIRSRCPIIFIESPEEHRLLSKLGEMCDMEKRKKKLVMWDCVSGPSVLWPDALQRNIPEDPATLLEPMDMLVWIERDADIPGSTDRRSGGGAVYVLLDLHNWLPSSRGGSQACGMDGVERDVIRKLRSMAEALKNQHKTIIIISRDRVMPPDLMEICHSMVWPLPTYSEIRTKLEVLLGELKGKVKALDPKADRTLPEFTDESRDEMSRAFCGLSMDRVEAVFKQNTVYDHKMTPTDHVQRIISAKKAIIADADCGLTYIDTENLPDIEEIGGLQVLKQYIRTRTGLHGEAARKYGLPHLKGMLLIGVQGCGKSMTAKSVGRMWRLPTLRLDVGSIFSSLVGASENRMRRAISYMEAMAPCVVWLDEIEKSMAGTGSSDRSDAGTAARVFSTMLTWMSDRTSAVYLCATANNPQTLPAEMIRAGRFDERFFIDLPTMGERREIFFNHLRRFKRNPGAFDLDALAHDDVSEHFSGAEIEASIIEAMTNGFSQGREFVTQDIIDACQATFPLAETMAEQVMACRGWAKDRCRPASERLSVSDRLKRRQDAARKLEEAGQKATSVMDGVDVGPMPPITDGPANSPALGD